MADGEGPDRLFSEGLAPSRGQYRAIAELACDLLSLELSNRFEASKAIVQLKQTIRDRNDQTSSASEEPWW